MLLCLFGLASACKDDANEPPIDFSNIENLQAMPLSVIQEVVQGKWKSLGANSCLGYMKFENSIVYITKDSVITIGPEDESKVLNWHGERYSYSWEKIFFYVNDEYAIFPNYTSLHPDEARALSWFPISIKNDSLTLRNGGNGGVLLLRIKD